MNKKETEVNLTQSYKIQEYNKLNTDYLLSAVGIYSMVFPTENQFYGIRQITITTIEKTENQVYFTLDMKEESINMIFLLDIYSRPICAIDLVELYNLNNVEKIKVTIDIIRNTIVNIRTLTIDLTSHINEKLFPHPSLIQTDRGRYKLPGIENQLISETPYINSNRLEFNTLAKSTIDKMFEYYSDKGDLLHNATSYNFIWNQITKKDQLYFLYQNVNIGSPINLIEGDRLTLHSVYGVLKYGANRIEGNSVYKINTSFKQTGFSLKYYPNVFIDYNNLIYFFTNEYLYYKEKYYESYLTRWLDFDSKIIPIDNNIGTSYLTDKYDFSLAPFYQSEIDLWSDLLDNLCLFVKSNIMNKFEKLILGKNALIIEHDKYIKWIPITVEYISNIVLYSASLDNVLCYTDMFNGILIKYKNNKTVLFCYNGEVKNLKENIIGISNVYYDINNGNIINNHEEIYEDNNN